MIDPDLKTQFEQILSRNRGRLKAISHVYADGDAEDLLQEILLQIWRSLSTFRQRSSIDTWCYRVALNTAISWQRRSGRRDRRLPPDQVDVSQLAGVTDTQDYMTLLHHFLQTLSATDRAIVLMYLDDLTGAEMAGILGISEGAVRVRVHRVKQRLSEWNSSDS